MLSRPSTWRNALLLLLCAFAVHQLRYALAFGDQADDALHAHGHGYLLGLVPSVGLVAALALGALLTRSAIAPAHTSTARIRLVRIWPLACAALLAVYAGQELVEGALSPGHPAGIAGVFGGGGWIAVPLAAAFGGVITLAIGIARRIEETHLGPTVRVRAIAWPAVAAVVSVAGSVALPAAPARHTAGRGPPVG